MKGAICYVAIATVIFSHVKITCYFHTWRYQVFARKLTWYFIGVYIITKVTLCYVSFQQIVFKLGGNLTDLKALFPAKLTDFPELVHVKSWKNRGRVYSAPIYFGNCNYLIYPALSLTGRLVCLIPVVFCL